MAWLAAVAHRLKTALPLRQVLTRFSSEKIARHPSSIEWVHCSWISVSKIPTWFSLQLALLQSILFTEAKLYFKNRNWTLSPPWFKPRLLHVASRAQQGWPKLIFPVCLQIGKVPASNEFFSFFLSGMLFFSPSPVSLLFQVLDEWSLL